MSTVYFKNGMLLLLGDERTKNEMSFKPTNDRKFDDKTKYWGRVNDFNYSIPWATVTCVVIGYRPVKDQVWIDNPRQVPVVQASLNTTFEITPMIDLTPYEGDADKVYIRPSSVYAIIPGEGLLLNKTVVYISDILEPLIVEENWSTVATKLIEAGWMQVDPAAYASATVNNES